jgi:hypothetical protein
MPSGSGWAITNFGDPPSAELCFGVALTPWAKAHQPAMEGMFHDRSIHERDRRAKWGEPQADTPPQAGLLPRTRRDFGAGSAVRLGIGPGAFYQVLPLSSFSR